MLQRLRKTVFSLFISTMLLTMPWTVTGCSSEKAENKAGETVTETRSEEGKKRQLDPSEKLSTSEEWDKVKEKLGDLFEQPCTYDNWEKVRGTGIAKKVQEICKGKKILIIRNHVAENARKDIAFEYLTKGLDGMTIEVYELPEVQVSENEPPADMGPNGLYDKLDNKGKEKFENEKKAITEDLKDKDFEMVVVWGWLNERLVFKGNGTTPSDALKDKLFVYPNGKPYLSRYGRELPTPAYVVAWIENKQLEEADWDKEPTGDQDKDFDARYSWIVNSKAKK